jgi:hypothetical protein
MKLRPLQISGQIAAFALFCAGIAYFSNHPAYQHRSPDDAQITVAFSHSGTTIRECRRLSPEEIAALAPNMRQPTDCPRARVPLHFVLTIDDAPVVDRALAPAGIADDGAASAYARLAVTAGPHRITAKLRDSRRESGYDWERTIDVELAPRRSLSVDFSPEAGGFVFR